MGITDETWWRRETVPPRLAALGQRLRAHYRLPATAVGTRGDTGHRRGYHRSREWIRRSAYCTNRSYSVSETAGNRSGGDDRWVCALDVTLPRAALIAACRRLDAAVRAGRLEKIVEWYGNADGDSRVDGYNNIANRVASSDDSHLWHLHLSFDRGRADEDHADVFGVLTGTGTPAAPPEGDDDMPTIKELLAADIDPTAGTYSWGGSQYVILNRTGQIQNELLPQVLAELRRLAAEDAARDKLTLAAIEGMARHGGPEAAPIVAEIRAAKEELRSVYSREIAALQEQLLQTAAELAELQEVVRSYREAEAAANRAAADELDPDDGP